MDFFLYLRILFTIVESLWRCITPRKPKRVAGKVVVVTGASGGFGKELATRFAKLGCKVALWDINESANLKAALELIEIGCKVRAYACDVTDAASVKRAANETRRDLGEPDILINNAGVLVCKDILSMTENEFRKTMDVNTVAHFITCKEFLLAMLSRNEGHIVTIASLSSKLGGSLLTDYCASKFGVDGFTEALEAEIRFHYKKSGITFTSVYPSIARTSLVTNLANRIDAGRAGENFLDADKVAQAIVDGILRNERYVYIPNRLSRLVSLLTVIPAKGKKIFLASRGPAFRIRSS